jgi:hypothetical protein
LFESCHGRRKDKTDNMMQEGNVEKNKVKVQGDKIGETMETLL